jgi:glycopeptide antibiotics resistance protein
VKSLGARVTGRKHIGLGPSPAVGGRPLRLDPNRGRQMLSGYIAWAAAMAVGIVVIARVRPLPKMLLALVALAHAAFVISVAIFPIPIDSELIEPARQIGWSGFAATSVDLTPFETIRRSLRSGLGSYQFTQALQNLFVLSPLGLFAPVLWPRLRTWAAFVPVAIVVGCSIEIAQLAISVVLGFPYRSIDIDDAILNTLGIVVLFALYRLVLGLISAMAGPGKPMPTGAAPE